MIEIVAGSLVRHLPTDEEWLVLGVQGDRICVAGWPATIAYASDCELLPGHKQLTESELNYRREFGAGWT